MLRPKGLYATFSTIIGQPDNGQGARSAFEKRAVACHIGTADICLNALAPVRPACNMAARRGGVVTRVWKHNALPVRDDAGAIFDAASLCLADPDDPALSGGHGIATRHVGMGAIPAAAYLVLHDVTGDHSATAGGDRDSLDGDRLSDRASGRRSDCCAGQSLARGPYGLVVGRPWLCVHSHETGRAEGGMGSAIADRPWPGHGGRTQSSDAGRRLAPQSRDTSGCAGGPAIRR